MKILVVEDEPRLQRNLTKALREEGYAVDAAGAGDDGIFKVETCGISEISPTRRSPNQKVHVRWI